MDLVTSILGLGEIQVQSRIAHEGENMEHQDFMREALRLAREGVSKGGGGPFGAVVVRHGEIIAGASNRVVVDNDPTAHAEMVAIRRAGNKLNSFDLEDCILYTSCEPCPMCLGASYWAHIKHIYYAATGSDAARAGFDDDFILDQLRLASQDRQIPSNRLLQNEGAAVFDHFLSEQDQVKY